MVSISGLHYCKYIVKRGRLGQLSIAAGTLSMDELFTANSVDIFANFKISLYLRQILFSKTVHKSQSSELRSRLDDSQSSAQIKSRTFVSDQDRVERAL